MTDPRSIVAATDFSRCSGSAVKQAARLARQTGATLALIHVIERGWLDDFAAVIEAAPSVVEPAIRARMEEKLASLVKEVGIPGRTSGHVLAGHAAEEITRFTQSLRGDLLVLGAYGERHAERGVGTIAARCARLGTVDTLLVRAGQEGAFKRIVVGTDFSRASKPALDQGVSMAIRDGAGLTVVHVHPVAITAVPAPLDPMGIWYATYPEIAESVAAYRAAVARRMEDFVREARRLPGAPPIRTELIEDAHRGHALAEFVRSTDADLVVLGDRGRSPWRTAILGSTAERMLQAAGCSMLLARSAVPAS